MNQGYIKLYRKILDNPIVMKSIDHLGVFLYLLLSATHKEIKVWFDKEEIILHSGELITSRIAIAEKMRIDNNKIQRILNFFESRQLIEQRTCSQNRLIKVKNWGLYQISEQQNDNKTTTSRQQSEHKQEIHIQESKNNISTTTNKADDTETRETEKKTLFEFMEETFSKIFNGPEQEKINRWVDNDATRYAIRQAALQGISNVMYIDAILEAYKKENITTLQQAKVREKKFQEEKQRRKNNADYRKKIQEPPSWFDKKIKETQMDNDELTTMNEMLSEFREEEGHGSS